MFDSSLDLAFRIGAVAACVWCAAIGAEHDDRTGHAAQRDTIVASCASAAFPHSPATCRFMTFTPGSVGLVFAPGGRLSRALTFTIAHGKIVAAEIIADSARLQELELAVLT